jgi:hypothetical protein
MADINSGAVSSGYLNFINNSLDRKRKEAELSTFLARNAEMAKQQRAKQLYAQALVQDPTMFGQTSVPQMQIPMAPGAPQAPGPGAASVPAGGSPSAPAGGPGGAAPIQPYLSYDDHVKKAQEPTTDTTMAAGVAPLPPAPTAKAAAANPAPQRQDIGAMIQALKKLGYSDQEVLGVLEERRAFLAPENKAEIDILKAETGIAVQTFRLENQAIKNELERMRGTEAERHHKATESTAADRAKTYKDLVAQRRTASDAIQKRFEKRAKTAEQMQFKGRIDVMLKEVQSIERAMDEVSKAVMAGYDVETNGTRLEALRKLWGEKMDAVNDAQGDLEDAIFEQRMGSHGKQDSDQYGTTKVPTATGKAKKPAAVLKFDPATGAFK